MTYVLIKNADLEYDRDHDLQVLVRGEIVFESDDYQSCLSKIPHPLSIDSCFDKHCRQFGGYYSVPTDDEFHLFIAYVEKRLARCSAYITYPDFESKRAFYDNPFGPSVQIPNSFGFDKKYYPPTDSNRIIFKRVTGAIWIGDYIDQQDDRIYIMPAIYEKICREQQLSLLNATTPPSTFFERELLSLKMDNITRLEMIRWLENVIKGEEVAIDLSNSEIESLIQSLKINLTKPAPTEDIIENEVSKEKNYFEAFKADKEIFFKDHPSHLGDVRTSLDFHSHDRVKFGVSYTIFVRVGEWNATYSKLMNEYTEIVNADASETQESWWNAAIRGVFGRFVYIPSDGIAKEVAAKNNDRLSGALSSL